MGNNLRDFIDIMSRITNGQDSSENEQIFKIQSSFYNTNGENHESYENYENYEMKHQNYSDNAEYMESGNMESGNMEYMQPVCDMENILPENRIFTDMLGKEILLVMDAIQLNVLGQVFRPIFTGTVVRVTNGFLTLDPVIVKMNTAPFYRFPTPLSFPLEDITYFTPFDPNTRISIP